LSISWI